MKSAALFILPQLKVGAQMSYLVAGSSGAWGLTSSEEFRDLPSMGLCPYQSCFVVAAAPAILKLVLSSCSYPAIGCRAICMIVESRIIFWKKVLNWLPLPSLTGYGALQNISPVLAYVKVK